MEIHILTSTFSQKSLNKFTFQVNHFVIF